MGRKARQRAVTLVAMTDPSGFPTRLVGKNSFQEERSEINQKLDEPRINLPVKEKSNLGQLLNWVAAPAGLNAIARNLLSVTLLHGTRAVQRLNLSENEVLALLDVVNGWCISPERAHRLFIELEDALESGRARKWGIDGQSLLWRIQTLHPFEAAALALRLQATWDVEEQYEGGLLEAAQALHLLPPEEIQPSD